MNETEQMMLQLWLGNLLRMLKEGEVEQVKSELETALERIEEDQATPSGDEPPASDGDPPVT